MLSSDALHMENVFGIGDWLVIAIYLGLTTVAGAMLSGKQATIRDFFLGGRRLPWWAISGSIIATEVSAVTFLAVPTLSYAAGGNLTFLQWAIGAIVARLIIGFYFVPKYYEREIYSPYDYLGRQLGMGVKQVSTGLFFVGAILGQGVRVYVTASVLRVVADIDLTTSIWLVGAFSVCWTLLGGMTTVIWTDVIQFILLTLGAILILVWATSVIPGGTGGILATAEATGKLEWFDSSTSLAQPYTIWVAILAMPFLNLAAFGTDQVMAQRMFCSRNQREARRAIIVSSVSMLLALVMLAVGIALYCYFQAHPFSADEQSLISSKKLYLVPIFIVRALPVGIRGLIVAAVFAAAISSLDSTLAALSQTTLSAFVKPRTGGKRRKQGRLRKYLSTEIGFSKMMVVGWGVVLCSMASACILIEKQYANAVDLAFALVGYTYGPLLGIFLLAFLPFKRNHRGLVWAVPMAMLAVFGIANHDWVVGHLGGHSIDLSDWIVWTGATAFIVAGLAKSQNNVKRVATITVGALAVVLLHRVECGVGENGQTLYIAYPWSYPIGTIITLFVGYCLGNKRDDGERTARQK